MHRMRTETLMKRKEIKEIVHAIYIDRKERAVHPEGKFDNAGRWVPDASENVLSSFACIRSPSRAWPYSYMIRARTRQHCRLLVQAWLQGLVTLKELPADAQDQIKRKAKLLGQALVAVYGKKGMTKYLRTRLLEASGVS